MSQEVQVLQCYACATFQTQIAKKAATWACKLCGERQSRKKVFGQGSGVDCRRHVQRVNDLRQRQAAETVMSESDGGVGEKRRDGGGKAGVSKWAKYLSQTAAQQSENEEEAEGMQWSHLPPPSQCTPVAIHLPQPKRHKTEAEGAITWPSFSMVLEEDLFSGLCNADTDSTSRATTASGEKSTPGSQLSTVSAGSDTCEEAMVSSSIDDSCSDLEVTLSVSRKRSMFLFEDINSYTLDDMDTVLVW